MKRRSGENGVADESCNAKASKNAEHGKGSGSWTEQADVLIYRTADFKIVPKMAAFDMDGTLITTKSGKRFPIGPDDWKLWSQAIPAKLRSLVAEKPPFCVVLLTNQAAIERCPGGGKKAFQRKVEEVVKALGVPAIVLIAVDPTGCSLYRKPCAGTMQILAEIGLKENPQLKCSAENFWDMKNSFYVGDAAGRVDGWTKGAKKDFACSDRLFALNAGLPFHTPEEFFLGHSPAPFCLPEFNPAKVDTAGIPTNSSIISSTKEMIVCVGPPACGKSSFSKKHFESSGRYDVFSRDDLGTWQACVAAAKKSLSAGKSVVIDNTNPDIESRSRYVQVAKDLKVPCRCFHFDVSIQHARHNERFRRLVDQVNPPPPTSKPHSQVPDLVFNMFKSKFKQPLKEEGFAEVVQVKFVAEFNDPVLDKLYRSYLIDK